MTTLNKTKDLLGQVHYIYITHTIEAKVYDLTICGLLVPVAVAIIKYDPAVVDRNTCTHCERYAHTQWADGLTADAIRAREAAK